MTEKNLKQAVLALICIFAASSSLFAQSKVIDLWNGKIPNAIANNKYKQIVDTAAGWVDKKSIAYPTLSFYPAPEAKSNGAAVIICPGGGYSGLAIKHEGAQVAQWLNTLGISAFVLKYRMPDDSTMQNKSVGPLQDGQKAIRYVRSHAQGWGIDPRKIGIMGFSAGGHLASTISTHYDEKVYDPIDTTSARPDFSLLIYPVVSMESAVTHLGSRENLIGKNPKPEMVKHFSNALQVTGKTPPAFLVHSMDDGVVPVENSIEYALALKKNKVPCELHIYESGGHGYGMGWSAKTETTWTQACRKWLETNGFLQKK